ncbi:MAG: amidohydrolase family protein, partial [Bacteroidales bacterium]|nr:amidohydrolase family protein [Bacteroidales bacterium]
MTSILLKNILLDSTPRDILVEGERISRITPAGESSGWALADGCEVCDCKGCVAAPGVINMHTHAGMSIMRGVGEDMLFHDWLAHIWKIEAQLDEDFVYWSAKVGCIEMIRTGTTTFNDMYWHHRAARKAAAETGIRIAGGLTMMDQGDISEAERQIGTLERSYEEDKAYYEGAIYIPSVHAVYSVSAPLFRKASDFARRHGLKLHLHLAETRKEVEDCKAAHGGMTPVGYLDSLGILGPEVIAAHSLWLTPEDIRILGRNGVTCVHCVNSNAKLSSGYRFMDKELQAAGANVCIGTDSACSSNN